MDKGRPTPADPFQAWMNVFVPGARMPDLGDAAAQMADAWTKVWQATLKGRVLPAMELMNPLAWTEGERVAHALESAFGTPQWSDMPSLDAATLHRLAPAVELAQVGQLYAASIAQVCYDICATFQARTAGTGSGLDGSGDALDLWNATVDEKLIAFNRSDTFAGLQRRFLRSLMAWRLEQRRMGAAMAEQFQLPTRDEVDELARRVHALERENRKLRRAVAARPPRTNAPSAPPRKPKEQSPA